MSQTDDYGMWMLNCRLFGKLGYYRWNWGIIQVDLGKNLILRETLLESL